MVSVEQVLSGWMPTSGDTPPPFEKVAQLYGAKGFKVERSSEIADAVEAALKCNKPAVIDIAVDPKALYSFRRDSFKHRSK